MKPLTKNIIIILLIMFNIALLAKINFLRTERNTCLNKTISLNRQLVLHKNYILENNKKKTISFDDVYKQLAYKSNHSLRDTLWVIIVPANVCMSCITNLFSDLANLQISKTNLYLIQEKPIKSIEREWNSYSFLNTLTDSQNIFEKYNINTNIVVAKIQVTSKQISTFCYEPELNEYLNNFIQDT